MLELHLPPECFLPTETAEEEEVLPPGGRSYHPHHPHHHHCCFNEKMRLDNVVRSIIHNTTLQPLSQISDTVSSILFQMLGLQQMFAFIKVVSPHTV